MIETIWTFSLWEVGYTLVDEIDLWKTRRRIRVIKNAQIDFYPLASNSDRE